MRPQKTPRALALETRRKLEIRKPQSLPSQEDQIKARIAARKAAEKAALEAPKPTYTRPTSMRTTPVCTKTNENHNYKISEESILEVLNATIKEGRNLMRSDCINLGDKIGVNHNSVKIISEFAQMLIDPTYTGVLNPANSQRYIQVMERALALSV